MVDVIELSPDKFDAMSRLLREATELRERSKDSSLTLAEKLELIHRSKAATEQARAIR